MTNNFFYNVNNLFYDEKKIKKNKNKNKNKKNTANIDKDLASNVQKHTFSKVISYFFK